MPRITSDGPSNAGVGLPPGGELLSAGSSFSTSESKPEQSGTSLQDTELSSQQPAPETESPSSEGQTPEQASSSSAPSASGSTPETGPSQQSPSDSSEDSAREREATADQPSDDARAVDLMAKARQAFVDGKYDECLALVDQAEMLSPEVAPDAERARQAVAFNMNK